MKHAFLIIAHNEPELLKILISMLDHQDCDIYLHIDKKADMTQFSGIETHYSDLHIIEDRINVKWGDYSQIRTEIKLFEEAYRHGGYSYYHLLSGVDLPIKPIDHILEWFENNKGYEYIGAKPATKKYQKRMKRRYFMITRKRNPIATIMLGIQKILGLQWNRKTEVWMGHNWGSFTQGFVKHIMDHKEWIDKHFKYSFCGDELYKPTLMRHLRKEQNDKGSVRHIDWQRGNPHTFNMADYQELMNSDKLFARKFSTEDKDLITQIRNSNKQSRRLSWGK